MLVMDEITERMFKNKLKVFREEKSMTQFQLGEEAGLSAVEIFDFETGNKLPSMRQLFKLCNALQVTPNDLFGMESDFYA